MIKWLESTGILRVPNRPDYGIIRTTMLCLNPSRSFRYVIPAALFLILIIGACSDADNEPSGSSIDATSSTLATPPSISPPTSVNSPSQYAAITPAPSAKTPEAEGIVRLPDDEGAHLTPVEWWYFNGHVDTDNGRTFSYHFVTFQSALESGLTPRLKQLSWTDHEQEIHLVDERADFPLVEATSGEFDLTTGDWRMSGDGKFYELSFSIEDYTVELEGRSTKPPVLHDETGYVDLGIAGKTYYYSHTDLETSGTVSVDGSSYPVKGNAWMDHQWGDFSTAQIGWDWFSLNMDDGSDLMVSVVWEQEGAEHIETYGTFVPSEDLPSVHLTGDDISIESTDTWTSPDTGGEYPMGWRLRVDSLNLDLVLTPVLKGAEFTQTSFIPVIYWEGAVTAKGSRNGNPISGRGFVEMVGYAPTTIPNLTTPNVGPAPTAASNKTQ